MLFSLAKRDKLERTDAAIVPSGNGFERVRTAIELYKSGFVRKLALVGATGSRPAQELKRAAIDEGIPERDIIADLTSRNTKENAASTLAIARREQWKKIILVTSPHHQLRAHLTFKKAWAADPGAPAIINYPPASYSWFDWVERGRNRRAKTLRLFYFFNEWLKIIKYRLKGDL